MLNQPYSGRDEELVYRGGGSSTTWHLCWQAAYGRGFFPVPTLYERIRFRLVQAHLARGGTLLSYTLLPTEIHTVADIPDGVSPVGIARAVGNVIARWVRGDQPLQGPVFAGPYRARRLGTQVEFRDAIRMLAWRPVALRLCAMPRDYAHAAFASSRGVSAPHKLGPLSLLLDGPVNAAPGELAACIAQRPGQQEWRCWELTHGLTLAQSGIGLSSPTSTEAKSPGAAALIAFSSDGGVDGALRVLEQWVTAKLHSPKALNLHKGSDATAVRARALVGLIAQEHHLCSAASVARYFGRSKATLSEQMAAGRERRWDRQVAATPVRRIIEDTSLLARLNFVSSQSRPRTSIPPVV